MTQQIEPRYGPDSAVHPTPLLGAWSGASVPAPDRGDGPAGIPQHPTTGHAPDDMPTAATPTPFTSLPPTPGPPLNGTAVASAICAFLVAPIAIMLGLLARRQIARTGERGRRLATFGTVLGSVVTAIGIATVIVMTSLTVTPGAPGSPVPVAPATPATAEQQTGGRANLLLAYGRLSTSAETFASNLTVHRGDTDAQQRDCAVYQGAVQSFRSTVAGMAFSPADQARVNGELLPATDVLVADLNTMAATASSSTLARTAGGFDRHTVAFYEVLRSVVSG